MPHLARRHIVGDLTMIIAMLMLSALPAAAQEGASVSSDGEYQLAPDEVPESSPVEEGWVSPLFDHARDPAAEGETLTEDRSAPDYDGRTPPKPSVGEALLWVPRVIFYPAYLVSEYVIRKPIGALVTWLERKDVIPQVVDALSFGTRGRVGLVPTALLDFGVRPSVGVYTWANHFPTAQDRLRIHFAYGGERWWRATVRQRIPFSRHWAPNIESAQSGLDVRFVFSQRPDHLYYVDDPDRRIPKATSFFMSQVEAGIGGEFVFGFSDAVRFDASFADLDFADGSTNGVERADETLGDFLDLSDRELRELISGFEGYQLVSGRAELALDTRPPRPNPGNGARLEAWSSIHLGADSSTLRFARLGVEGALFGDVGGRQRVVSLRQRIETASNIGSSDIPVVELPTLGGVENMRGFLEGRFRGPTTSVTSLQYTYPIWSFADGMVFYEVGNAFGSKIGAGEFVGFDVSEFRFGQLSQSFGLGMTTNSDRDARVALILAGGTTEFDDGARFEHLRVLFGTTRGF